MDRQSVYTTSVYQPSYGEEDGEVRGQILLILQKFILEFQLGTAFIYRLEIHWHSSSACSNLAQRPTPRKCDEETVFLRRGYRPFDFLQRRARTQAGH